MSLFLSYFNSPYRFLGTTTNFFSGYHPFFSNSFYCAKKIDRNPDQKLTVPPSIAYLFLSRRLTRSVANSVSSFGKTHSNYIGISKSAIIFVVLFTPFIKRIPTILIGSLSIISKILSQPSKFPTYLSNSSVKNG